ncbi:hypothetical protein CRI63_16555 [Escherichia sp. E2661]|nr:hypothetical protein CRI63_16555 [Escherichia sp. E2661]
MTRNLAILFLADTDSELLFTFQIQLLYRLNCFVLITVIFLYFILNGIQTDDRTFPVDVVATGLTQKWPYLSWR